MNEFETFWYEVYEDEKRGSSKESSLAFCKYKYTAETVARYFPESKIRKIQQLNAWSFITLVGEEIKL